MVEMEWLKHGNTLVQVRFDIDETHSPELGIVWNTPRSEVHPLKVLIALQEDEDEIEVTVDDMMTLSWPMFKAKYPTALTFFEDMPTGILKTTPELARYADKIRALLGPHAPFYG